MTAVPEISSTAEPEGRLADSIACFARTLRRAGLPIGPAATLDAIAAVRITGLASRDDFYWTLHAALVTRQEDRAVFADAFRRFWRSRDPADGTDGAVPPIARRDGGGTRARERSVFDALFDGSAEFLVRQVKSEIDATLGVSEGETFNTKDFGQMTAPELEAAKAAIRGLRLPADRVRTRRYRPDAAGRRIDPRATMRDSLRGGGLILPRFRIARETQPPLVVLADISGSMSRYTRIFLYFLHALTAKRRHVHTFLFGTRLTDVTRQMRRRDPDAALDDCAAAVKDWSGGTRIAGALAAFNKGWSRRVLTGGAVAILVTDGLERGSTDDLGREMDRLHRSCRRLIWLNPLLRFDGFSAQARGVRAILPHVDEFRPVHSLRSMDELCRALSASGGPTVDPKRWLAAAA